MEKKDSTHSGLVWKKMIPSPILNHRMILPFLPAEKGKIIQRGGKGR
jgi:hypothetical protein